MKRPSMILFDYGQTLIDERPFRAGRSRPVSFPLANLAG